jgi:hypothetical protein
VAPNLREGVRATSDDENPEERKPPDPPDEQPDEPPWRDPGKEEWRGPRWRDPGKTGLGEEQPDEGTILGEDQ